MQCKNLPPPLSLSLSDDILVMVLAKEEAIQEWRTLIGPTHPNKVRGIN